MNIANNCFPKWAILLLESDIIVCSKGDYGPFDESNDLKNSHNDFFCERSYNYILFLSGLKNKNVLKSLI